MDGMSSYVRPPNLPSDAEMVAAFNALSTDFARGIVHYIAAKPGTRIPELGAYFDKHSAAVRIVVVNLEAVGILRVVTGSERKIGAGFSHAYEVDKDRVGGIYLFGHLRRRRGGEHELGCLKAENPPASGFSKLFGSHRNL
jgi:hypothetical protein